MSTTTRIGSVVIEQVHNAYRVRIPMFTETDKSYKYISIKGGLTALAYSDAILLASQIDKEIKENTFEPSSIEKYRVIAQKKQTPVVVAQEKPKELTNLLDLWENYKEAHGSKVSITTKNSIWKMYEKAITKIPEYCFLLPDCKDLIKELQKLYSDSTVRNFCCCCIKPAINLAYNTKLITTIPNIAYLTYKNNKVDKGVYTLAEVQAIFKGFDNKVKAYTDFIKILAYTGRRPQDVIALTKGDINLTNKTIVFNKAYTKGVLKSTKNDKVTVYPIDSLPELINLLERRIKFIYNKSDLVFPNNTNGNYIDLTVFGRKYWKPICEALIREGNLSAYRPLYNLRHFRATQMLQSGIDLQTIAYLLETSIEMLQYHYLSYNREVKLPSLE